MWTTFRHAEPVMGTVVSFDVRHEAGDQHAAAARAAVAAGCGMLHEADEVFSLWKPDTVASRLRRGALTVRECPPEVGEVLQRCADARQRTEGWFDPWAAPGGLDLTGLVKGWAAQRACDAIRSAGLPAAMVNAGGDIACYGGPEPGHAWMVGIQDPQHPGKVIRVLEIAGGAVATSGTYERGDHVYDPFTGRAVLPTLQSATVVTSDLGLADAMATALFAAGEGGLSFVTAVDGASGYVVRTDGSRRAAGPLPVVGGRPAQ